MTTQHEQQKGTMPRTLRPSAKDATLTIPVKKYRGDSIVISSRLTGELVNKLDEIAEQTGRTRNEIIQMCLEFAVDNLEIK